MDAVTLTAIAGVAWSLLFSYIPGLNTKFDGLAGDWKRLIMAGILLVTSAAIFGLACSGQGGFLGITITCNEAGIWNLVSAFVLSLVANQSMYAISPGKH